VKFEIVKIEQLTGNRTTVYSVIIDEEELTLFEQFIAENIESHRNELQDITERIKVIATKTGAIESFFDKPEGKIGQDIFALYDKPKSHLRLYCMRFSKVALILGGGGHKPKSIRSFQEDPKLKYENYLLREISDRVTKRIIEKEIWWSEDGMELTGNLIFDYED